MCSEAGLVNGLWGYQAFPQSELAGNLHSELIFAHRLRSDDVIQAVQSSFQHFDQDFSELVDEHRTKGYIGKTIDCSTVAQIVNEKLC